MDFKTDQSVKFHFDEKKPENGFLQVRIGTNEALNDIHSKTRKKTVELKPMFKHGPLQRIENLEVDDQLETDELWDFTIVDWGGVVLDGKEIKCTRKNKVKMMNMCPDFAAFYTKSLRTLNKQYVEQFGGTSELGNS